MIILGVHMTPSVLIYILTHSLLQLSVLSTVSAKGLADRR